MKKLIATAFIASAGLALASSAHGAVIGGPLGDAVRSTTVRRDGVPDRGGAFAGHIGRWAFFLPRRLIHPQQMRRGPGASSTAPGREHDDQRV